MKLFKPTLGKKIFLLLLVSFCFVNILNVFLDFDREKSHAYENLENSYMQVLANQLQVDYSDHYNQLDTSFFKTVNRTLNQKNQMDYPNVLVLDQDFQMVYNQHEQVVPYLCLSKSSKQDEKTYYQFTCTFQLSALDQVARKELEETLQKKFTGDTFEVQIASQKYDQIKNESTSMVNDDLSYLAIDDHVFFDQRKDDESIEKWNFASYESSRIYMGTDKIHPRNNEIGYHELNYQEIRENVLKSLKESLPTMTTESFSLQNLFEEDGTLYSIVCLPLIKKDAQINVDSEYDVHNIGGYLVYYNYDYHAMDRIMDNVILFKIPTYGVSFVFIIILCSLLSYMFTKRIRKISKSTLAIANNQFDIHLDEKSKDELGLLSHNINNMSQQLSQTMKQLHNEIEHVKKLESVRKEFIANFTHEIKTPLGIINGYIELIEVVEDEKKKKEYLNAIEEEVKRIDELVKAMLNLSRLESGHVELNIQSIDLEDLLSSVIDSFAPLLEKKNIHIRIGGEFENIQADIFELQMVLMNFISNAIKHTNQNGYIYITYQHPVLNIENEGEHLTKEQKETIWDTYVSSDREGTGLGLAICKTILDLHEFGYNVINTDKGVQFQINFNTSR